jgi:hypothetical protein
MTGTSLDFAKHCKLPYGAYTEAHKEYPQTNTMAQHNRGVICLGPTRNFQGSYKMMCLKTGRKVTRRQFQELPMPDSIIKRIEVITEKEKQEKILVFSNRNDNPIGKDENVYDGVTAGVGDNDDDDNDGVGKNPTGILLNESTNEESKESNSEEDESTGVKKTRRAQECLILKLQTTQPETTNHRSAFR